MDFVRDLELISRNFLDCCKLDRYKVDYSAILGWEIVRMFAHVQSKLINQTPRNVIKSKKLQNSSNGETIKQVLLEIENKLRNGTDINPHLNKTIFDGTHTDCLLADWNIYHLHLSTEADENHKYFVGRTRDVLFLTISGDAAYFIDVRPHGKNGEANVFEQKNLLQAIADEWPWVLEPYKIEGAIGVEYEVNDPKEIKELRKAGVSVIHKINDGIYTPMGMGLTTASTSVKATRESSRLYYLAKDAMKYVIENRAEIDRLFSQVKGYNPSNAIFRLQLSQSGFQIGEDLTQSAIRLEDLGLA